MKKSIVFILVSFVFFSCQQKKTDVSGGNMPVSQYFSYSDSGVQSAGIKMIPVKTPVGELKVWTKRFGNYPKI